jgi:hypothetical protein
MAIDPDPPPGREAVAVFDTPESLETAIDELLSSGFDRAELSLLASEHAVEEKLGHRYARTSDLADADVPRTAFVSTAAIGDAEGALIGGLIYVGATAAAGAVVASGGLLAAAIAAGIVAGGTGGLIGAVLAKWVSTHHARYFHDQIERGGLLLWVHAGSTADEERAVRILEKHVPGKVHVHGPPADRATPVMRAPRPAQGPPGARLGGRAGKPSFAAAPPPG